MKAVARGLLGALAFVAAAAYSEPMEDVDYVRIDPQPVADAGRIEVIEFFYYGCDACARFAPLLDAWLSKNQREVEFRRIPALRRADWIPLTRLYFALEALNATQRLHAEVYRAIHERGLGLQSRREAVDWARSHGIDAAAFEDLLMSDAVLLKVQQARDTTVGYGIRTTPSLVVDGRYVTSGAIVGDVQRLTEILDGLVDMARKRRAAGNE